MLFQQPKQACTRFALQSGQQVYSTSLSCTESVVRSRLLFPLCVFFSPLALCFPGASCLDECWSPFNCDHSCGTPEATRMNNLSAGFLFMYIYSVIFVVCLHIQRYCSSLFAGSLGIFIFIQRHESCGSLYYLRLKTFSLEFHLG